MSLSPIRALKSVLRPGGTPAFLVLSVAVGVLVGLAAAALILALDLVGEALSELRSGAPWEPLLFVPIGLLAAWLVAQRFAPEIIGDGVPDTIEALALHGGRIKTRTAPLKLLATTLTLGLGGSAGREGPMVQVGGSIGSSLARHWGVGEDQVRSLVAAGAGAAIGASFNAPIAGMLFAMEVLLRNFAVRHVNSVVLASVAAAVTSRSIVGEERILRAFPFGLSDPRELILYAVLGVLAVVAGAAFLWALDAIEGREFVRLPKWAVPVIGGLAVGGLAMIDDRVLGSGQEVVGSLVGFDPAGGAWWGLVLLAGGKIVATVLTIGSRGSGGAFMPSLFIGAALGAGFARLVAPIWSFTILQPGA
ncbi:MAG TPA: chloride channel protein, partial [Actinobacteria bacterium]|nr:chloride channel protein [Actinomycetota bacterium]